MITRRDFLKVTGVAAAAAALTACGGSSSTASSAASSTAASSEAASAAAKLDKVKVAVPNDTTNEARALTLLAAPVWDVSVSVTALYSNASVIKLLSGNSTSHVLSDRISLPMMSLES